MTDADLLGELLPRPPRDERVLGVAVGIVTNNKDPDGLGRVKLRFPWLSDVDESHWARVASPMAGPGRGLYLLPEVDDEVLVMFEQGRIDSPFVIGSLWNGQDPPPATNNDGANNLRVLKSRSGHTITLDDTDGAEKITIADKQGKNTVVIDSAANSITLTADQDVKVVAKGNVSIEAGGDLSLKCNALTVEAQQSFALKANQDGKVEAQSGLALSCLAGVNVNDGALEVR